MTMNPFQSSAEAVAVKGCQILKVGTTHEISRLIGKETKVIRLDGRTVVPGFIDTHIHIADFARFLLWLDLTATTSIKEMQALLGEHVQKIQAGKWVIGRGWNETRFVRTFTQRFDLDAVSPIFCNLLLRGWASVCCQQLRFRSRWYKPLNQ